MHLHQGLAQRTTALLQRLEVLEPLAPPDDEPAESPTAERLRYLSKQITQLKKQNAHRDTLLAELAPHVQVAVAPTPTQLTWRARRLLLQGRDLLDQLKSFAGAIDQDAEEDPLPKLFYETLAMTELVLRTVQTFPAATGDQLKLCDGSEVMLGLIADRVEGIRTVINRRRNDSARVEILGGAFVQFIRGQKPPSKLFQDLAEAILEDARQTRPLRFVHADPHKPELWAAAHCLNVAQVMARLVPHNVRWRGRPLEPILCALVYDAGMAALPSEVLVQTEPLSDDQRRQIEAHVGPGVEAVSRLVPAEGWLADAVHAHHERLDGTGYPAGVQGQRIPHLARFLAFCDVYSALSSPRPHRPALPPRTALTETLLEAEKGRLDAELAEQLLALSFYPVGTVVELSSGHLGIVAATDHPRGNRVAPARPIVQVLADEAGKPPPWPIHVNLAQCESQHIVRSLNPAEGRAQLGLRQWQLL